MKRRDMIARIKSEGAKRKERAQMEKSNRVFLQRGQAIWLCMDSVGHGKQKFVIQSVIGEGGSSVCYDAIRVRDGLPGKLKEFYPVDTAFASREQFYSLERCDSGQLIPKDGTIRRFHQMCEEYLSTYTVLNKVMADNPKNQVLKNYIQGGEILFGIEQQSQEGSAEYKPLEATVYIWSPGIMGQGFDEYLADVRKNPEVNADVKIRDILSTVTTLTDCIRALHRAGLIHLDIKPSNFQVPFDSKNGINANSISLFDINTLYSINNDIPRMAGTEGYRAPEVFRGRADNRSDIYSIGAMLFNALVILEGIPDGLYRDRYYADIDRMVRHSELIRNSSENVKLISTIANILKKCLARHPNNRYDSCTSLLQALESAKAQAEIIAGNPALIGQNQRLAIVDVNEQGISSPTIVIQKMLYEHPLYAALQPGQKQINVLVIGSGTYGQKFIDQCLQAGQMKGYSLHITAVSNTPEQDRQTYLQFRPALSRFVNVNGSMEADARAYGTLRFLSLNEACRDNGTAILHFTAGKNDPYNRQLVHEIITHSDQRFDYIFIALGNTIINQEIGRLCEAEISADGRPSKCPVCYICEFAKGETDQRPEATLYPVRINEPITPETISPLLEQMAFNTDISWNHSLNFDVQSAFSAFWKDKYRYESSLAYALSIPYKLFSIGIILQSQVKSFSQAQFPHTVLVNGVAEAAEVFYEKILAKRSTDKDAECKFNALVWLEHRRWVLHLVCQSWNAPLTGQGQLDLERCVSERTIRNEFKMTHPCIVFSTEAAPLSSPAYEENDHRMWEEPNMDPALDELDRMSVELHQRFQERASLFRESDPLQSEDILAIERLLIGADGSVIKTYRQFLFCLKRILEGSESYTRQYDYYQGRFTDELRMVTEETKRDILVRLELIRKSFFPVIEANLHRNYKAYDGILVEKIPFILTYHFQDTLALAFADGAGKDIYDEGTVSNIASVTLLCPKKVLYLYHYTPAMVPSLLADKLSAVIDYLNNRRIHCKIALAVAFPTGVGGQKRDALQSALNTMLAGKQQDFCAAFSEYEILDFSDSQEATARFLSCMERHHVSLYDSSNALFQATADNNAFANALNQANCPNFAFAWKQRQFTKYEGCAFLQYIQCRSRLRANDVFTLMNVRETSCNLPEFSNDYHTLWNIYSGGNTSEKEFQSRTCAWNCLCEMLLDYEKQQQPIAVIHPEDTPGCPQKVLTFVLPAYTFKTVHRILDRLQEYHAIDEDSAVTHYTSESCMARIIADIRFEAAICRLFERPEILLDYYGVDAVRKTDGSIQFVYHNLKVTGLNIAPYSTGNPEFILEILQKLSRNHFISHLFISTESPRRARFEYASPRIKNLLTTPGEILRVYTYYGLLNTGYFDDVVCGYEFCWRDRKEKDKLDIIAVKGFRSVIVECGAGTDYLHIFEHFGSGTSKVLLKSRNADCAEDSAGPVSPSDVSLVSGRDEMNNIGQTIIRMLENT